MNNPNLQASVLLLLCMNACTVHAVTRKKVIYEVPEELKKVHERKFTPEIRVFPPPTPKTPQGEKDAITDTSSLENSPSNKNVFKMRTTSSLATSPDCITIPRDDLSDTIKVRHSSESDRSLPSSFNKRKSLEKAIEIYEELARQQRVFTQKSAPDPICVPQGKSWNFMLICACFPFLKK